jgi:hypothetical protein
MESHALPGTIQVTERTYRRLKDGFVLEPRTGLIVKGKGRMTTYVLLAERGASAVASTGHEPATPSNGNMTRPRIPPHAPSA